MVPKRTELPDTYHGLLDWYEHEYSKSAVNEEPRGLVDRMWGLGKHVWFGVDADAYVKEGLGGTACHERRTRLAQDRRSRARRISQQDSFTFYLRDR